MILEKRISLWMYLRFARGNQPIVLFQHYSRIEWWWLGKVGKV